MSYNNLDETNDRIAQPNGITIPLMEHQKSSIYAMKQIEDTGKVPASDIKMYEDTMNFDVKTCIGILADNVGAGKSLMAISLIEVSRIPPKRKSPRKGIFSSWRFPAWSFF